MDISALAKLSDVSMVSMVAPAADQKPVKIDSDLFSQHLASVAATNAKASATEVASDVSTPETTQEPVAKDAALAKSFESMIVGLMMKPLFAEFAEFTFGKGVESDVYTSLFSDAVADAVTKRGDLGLDKYTQRLNASDQIAP